jgi:hypothetical protein
MHRQVTQTVGPGGDLALGSARQPDQVAGRQLDGPSFADKLSATGKDMDEHVGFGRVAAASTSTPTNASTAAPSSRYARRRRSTTKTTCPMSCGPIWPTAASSSPGPCPAGQPTKLTGRTREIRATGGGHTPGRCPGALTLMPPTTTPAPTDWTDSPPRPAIGRRLVLRAQREHTEPMTISGGVEAKFLDPWASAHDSGSLPDIKMPTP